MTGDGPGSHPGSQLRSDRAGSRGRGGRRTASSCHGGCGLRRAIPTVLALPCPHRRSGPAGAAQQKQGPASGGSGLVRSPICSDHLGRHSAALADGEAVLPGPGTQLDGAHRCRGLRCRTPLARGPRGSRGSRGSWVTARCGDLGTRGLLRTRRAGGFGRRRRKLSRGRCGAVGDDELDVVQRTDHAERVVERFAGIDGDLHGSCLSTVLGRWRCVWATFHATSPGPRSR